MVRGPWAPVLQIAKKATKVDLLRSTKLQGGGIKISTMSGFGQTPTVVYLNENEINQFFSMLNRGKVDEIIERSRDLDSSSRGVGIKKILQMHGGSSSEEETETEIHKDLNPIAKFAIIYTLLIEEGDINFLGAEGEHSRPDLDSPEFVEAEGRIEPSPLNVMQARLDQAEPWVEMMDEIGHDAAKEFEEVEIDNADTTAGWEFIQRFIGELAPNEEHYRMDVDEDKSNLIFTLPNEGFEYNNEDFPAEYTSYRILCRVEHVYSEGEEEYHIDIMDLVEASDHQT